MISKNEIRFARYFMFLFLSYATLIAMTYIGDFLSDIWSYLPLLILFFLLSLYGAITLCYQNLSNTFTKSFVVSFLAYFLSFTAAYCAIELYTPPKGAGLFDGLGYFFCFIIGAFTIAVVIVIPLCSGINFVLRSIGDKFHSKWLSD